MIKGIRSFNYLGQSSVIRTDFPFSEMTYTAHPAGSSFPSVEQGPFLLYSIDGLDPGEANIVVTEVATTDGAIFNSARRTSKELTLTFLLNETSNPMYPWIFSDPSSGKTIQSAKDKVRKYFPLKTKIKLLFCQDNYVPLHTEDMKKYKYYMCEGYVKSISYDTFSKMCAASVTILMPDPYFYFVLSDDNLNILTDISTYNSYDACTPYYVQVNSSVYNPDQMEYGIDRINGINLYANAYNDNGLKIYYDIIIPITTNISVSDLENNKYQIEISNNYELHNGYRAYGKNVLRLILKTLLSYSTFSSRGLVNGDILIVSSQIGKKDVGIRLSGTTTDISITSILDIERGEWPYVDSANAYVYASIVNAPGHVGAVPISSVLNSTGFSIKCNYKRSGL